jgi:wyosine [tRNA(Phe)-imidazoG37] synthetase (radical SAM superfamily)
MTAPSPEGRHYVFGPVVSRRLGRSLGVDLVPLKTCTYDCLYCQLGRTTHKTTRRRQYVPVEAVLAQVRRRLDEGACPDYLTLSGSGEPTLHAGLDQVVAALKAAGAAPVAILTNGALLGQPAVRRACAQADVVMPTLTATRDEVFRRIHRPAEGLRCEAIVRALAEFAGGFAGRLWLEVMLLEGINTADAQIADLRRAIERIRPDRVQVNTVVRPPADAAAVRVEPGRLADLAARLREDADVIADPPAPAAPPAARAVGELQVLTLLRRRPCRLSEIAAGLGAHPAEVAKLLSRLQRAGRVSTDPADGSEPFYRASRTDRPAESP